MNSEREPVWPSGKALGLSAEDDGSSFSSNDGFMNSILKQ